jgi:hypothetical protein
MYSSGCGVTLRPVLGLGGLVNVFSGIVKTWRDRPFSRFTLTVHRDSHRLNFAFVNGGTQPITLLQLSFLESVLPNVRAQIPKGTHSTWAEEAGDIVVPLYHASDPPGRMVAPLVVEGQHTEVASVEQTWKTGRAPLPTADADGMQFLLKLRVTAASGKGKKVERDIPLLRFSAAGSAYWEPPLRELADAGRSQTVRLI